MKHYNRQKRRHCGGVYRRSKKQRGGVFKGSRKQRGGFLPLIPAGILAGLKAVGIASALGAAGAIGSETVGAVSRKIRGAGKRRRNLRKKF